MYSYEIEKILESENYNIPSKMYSRICKESPQITRMKYDAFSNSYEIWTIDDYYWKFNVHSEE